MIVICCEDTCLLLETIKKYREEGHSRELFTIDDIIDDVVNKMAELGYIQREDITDEFKFIFDYHHLFNNALLNLYADRDCIIVGHMPLIYHADAVFIRKTAHSVIRLLPGADDPDEYKDLLSRHTSLAGEVPFTNFQLEAVSCRVVHPFGGMLIHLDDSEFLDLTKFNNLINTIAPIK